ncbi:nitroreductase family protein [Nocardia vinacea]|uniref:Nitroreductase family protein n=1 Tax=Nocardia vinacea TaxID=96468 RepID=A0ABZ1YME9_9NOCA|nr:nitroreductase family protein [Nocardia vinacea]
MTTFTTRLLADRWSCRGFLPEPVSRETITQVLDLARRSPSWCTSEMNRRQASLIADMYISRVGR